MLSNESASPAHPTDLADEAITTVQRWLAETADLAAERKRDVPAQRLGALLKDPDGLGFAIRFVDGVIRPADIRVAGRNFELVSRRVPAFLPWHLRIAIQLGGGFAPIVPWPIVPLARRAFRHMVGHLVLDATPQELDKHIVSLRGEGVRLNLNLLGEAVLGNDEAGRRLESTRNLLARDDVDYVSIKVSAVTGTVSVWAHEETVARVVTRLTPLYEFAAASASTKFINLDMEEFRDLDLTVDVFKALLDQPRLEGLEAGIVLQAYLPDSTRALQDLTEWATRRRARGGAGIKVRVVKGANLAMERVDAAIHGWPLATWPTKRETDTHYKRLLTWAMTPERTDAVRLGIAGHNLFDVAFAWLLAKDRGVSSRVDFEMLLGMAADQVEVVKRDVGEILLYTPVVKPADFDAAIAYLVRRLEENASPDNFLSALSELESPATFEREKLRFRAALAHLDDPTPISHRVQNRLHPLSEVLSTPREPGFRNTPDTDPSISANRVWGQQILQRARAAHLETSAADAARVLDSDALQALIAATARSGGAWGERTAVERATVLHEVGDVLAAYRGRLIETMASECGKTIAEADVEVSEAIDFAHYYAEQALRLDSVDNARFIPSQLIVVASPWNFPVAIPAGSVLAALAAGSGVILKPARLARRCGAILAEVLWEAGVPRDLLALVELDEPNLREQLITHPDVDRVILTGGLATATQLRSLKNDLPLLAETSGKNAIIVTPSADIDLAVGDVVRSAFGHAGQKCSAASLVILVGSVSKSERFRRQLEDAVRSMVVGYPQDAESHMGPLIESPRGKLREALTTLSEGERWIITPAALDGSDRLWSPGVKDGVRPGSEFHRTEYFGPVLGIMHADSLDEAIDLQNATEFGLTAGIHSLDADEIATWLESAEAGNLYVNRGITGAIVQRQPFGGWKRSSVGTGAKAGGPNYLLALGDWEPVFAEPGSSVRITGVSESVRRVIEAAQPGLNFLGFDRVRAGAVSDERAWASEYGLARDVSGIGVERNVFRYRPTGVTVRLAEGESLAPLVRVIVAATRSGAPVNISSAIPLPAKLLALFDDDLTPLRVGMVTVESDARWQGRAAAGELATTRIRLIGTSGAQAALATVLGGSIDVAVYAGPVTTSGRLELLPFLQEQSISITAHRFGHPDPIAASIVL
ncbi:MAG: aldehyde dehydrogenase family protein [Homoserinimonas sp.]|nr:aldehyde dehydrogenase family protein [Homoserinimonas sp.]